MKMKGIARSGAEGNCRLLSKYGGGSSGPRQHYASGGVVKARADGGEVMEEEEVVDGEQPMPRLDKPSRKPKGESKTVVNVVIAGKDDSQGMPALGGPPLGLPGGGPQGGLPVGGSPAGGMPPLPMRKSGGRICAKGGVVMKDGAGSAEGRLEKVKKYGK